MTMTMTMTMPMMMLTVRGWCGFREGRGGAGGGGGAPRQLREGEQAGEGARGGSAHGGGRGAHTPQRTRPRLCRNDPL
eukprot:953567-Rhodomonas_salina.1